MSSEARKIALQILNEVDKRRRTLDSILADVCAKETLIRQDRALLNAIVYGVLRWRKCLDHIISHYSKIRLDKIEPKVLNILRLGIFQIRYLDRIPESAAVNTSVEIAKSVAGPWVAGFVNAILRNVSRSHGNVTFPDFEKDPVSALSIRKSFPAWLVARWLDRFGIHKTATLCDTINTIPPISLRTNTIKISREILLKTIQTEATRAEPMAYAPDGICIAEPSTSIPELDAFQKGSFQVQDEAAQLVSLLLNPKPQETVLDACAGLGGKTGHIAQLMKNQGKIIALDKNAARLKQLEADMHRLGITIGSTRHQDLYNLSHHQEFGPFDRILLDAPCSGLGVLRRNPDIKWSSSKQNLKRYYQRQATLLELLSPFLRPSGILVYAVCSTEPEENEAVIETFLKGNKNFGVDTNHGCLPQEVISLMGSSRYIRTYPDFCDMDGFFMARLRRVG